MLSRATLAWKKTKEVANNTIKEAKTNINAAASAFKDVATSKIADDVKRK